MRLPHAESESDYLNLSVSKPRPVTDLMQVLNYSNISKLAATFDFLLHFLFILMVHCYVIMFEILLFVSVTHASLTMRNICIKYLLRPLGHVFKVYAI